MGSHTTKRRAEIRFGIPRALRIAVIALGTIMLYAGIGARPASAATATIYNLGTLGGTISVGEGINASGQVVGYSYTTGDIAFHAFLYTGTPGSGGAMIDLGTPSGTGSTFGYAINASGQVTGSNNPLNAHPRAFRYTGTPGNGGAFEDMGTPGSWGYAINASGQIAGFDSHAFLYTGTPGSGGAKADLGTLSGPSSIGYGINDSGQVTGESYVDMPDEYGDLPTHAFLYTGTPGSGGAMVDLGTLAGTFSSGRAINASGQITGSSSTTDYGDIHAFLYTGTPGSGGAMADLGTLGGSHSEGSAINTFGQVVGSSVTTPVIGNVDGPAHAFFYTGTPGVNGVMLDLDAWLDANNPTEGAKWTMGWASGLTDTGLISGGGYYDDGIGGLSDGYRAFVLDASSLVPEPAAPSMLSIALAAALMRRRKNIRRRGCLDPGRGEPCDHASSAPVRTRLDNKKGQRNMDIDNTPTNSSMTRRTGRILFRCFYLVACVIVPLAALWPATDPHLQRTAMFQAAQRGNVAAIDEILRGGLDVDCCDETGITPLMAAARAGQLDAVRKLLAAGARINACAAVSGTPLMLAAYKRHHDVMRELIERGADMNADNPTGQTALWNARLRGDDEAVRILIAAGAVAEGHGTMLSD